MSSLEDIPVGLALLLIVHNQNQKMNDELVKKGWFYHPRMTWRIKKEEESIDEHMEQCILENYDEIKHGYCYEPYPHRKPILEEAFKLFEEERYVACIPLFLSQIDGIARDTGAVNFFKGDKQFSKKKNADPPRFTYYIHEKATNDESKELVDKMYGKFLAENSEYLHIFKNTKYIDDPNEIGYLNRHGILHGHIEYIQYGSRLNALKVITALLFVIGLHYQVSLKTKK